jgi:hypothetical protein
MSVARPLIFSVSSTIVDRYKTNTNNYSLFNNLELDINEDDNLLIVYIDSENYKPTAPLETDRIQGYSGAMVKLTYLPYAIDIEVTDQRIDIYNALNDLINDSLIGGSYTLIHLYDYHCSTVTSEFIERDGILEIVPNSGVMVGYNGKYNNGFSMRFEQVNV